MSAEADFILKLSNNVRNLLIEVKAINYTLGNLQERIAYLEGYITSKEEGENG